MRVLPMVLIWSALAGCATNMPARPGDTARDPTPAAPAVVDAVSPFPQSSGLPQFVIPVTGGPMIMALPLGGSFYLPLDGGAPVTGIPTSP